MCGKLRGPLVFGKFGNGFVCVNKTYVVDTLLLYTVISALTSFV